MSATKELFTAIKSLILNSVNNIQFEPDNIRQSFQVPTSNNFISFISLGSKKTGIKGYDIYDVDNDSKENIILFEHNIQVDFFSDTNYIANDAANNFYQYLSSYAMDFLNKNYPTISLGIIENTLNLTDIGDKANYLYRFVVRFSIYTHNIFENVQQYYDNIEVKIEYLSEKNKL